MLFLVNLSILHENVFQLHKIHTKPQSKILGYDTDDDDDDDDDINNRNYFISATS